MKKQFYRQFIFSKTPLKSYFRFEDVFQIYPCDFINAPKFDRCDDIPLVIEYWVNETENSAFEPGSDESINDILAKLSNQTNKLNRLVKLLTAITNHRFISRLGNGMKWGFAFPETVTEGVNDLKSQPFIEWYLYPEMKNDLLISDFSMRGHPYTSMLSHPLYYQYEPLDNKEKEITLPETLEEILRKYYTIDEKTREIVDTVAHLINNGVELKDEMRSLSFISFISSIETLVNYEFKKQNEKIEFECSDCQTIKSSPFTCPKCGRPVWGVKAKFKEFLKRYVARSDYSIKKFNNMYNLRSKIIHNGMLLLGDKEVNLEHTDERKDQRMIHIETMQLARLSLVNWLLLR